MARVFWELMKATLSYWEKWIIAWPCRLGQPHEYGDDDSSNLLPSLRRVSGAGVESLDQSGALPVAAPCSAGPLAL